MTRVLAADSSIIVKWYKPDELFREEALVLKNSVVSGQTMLLTTELLPLEVSRAVTKAGATATDVKAVNGTLSTLYNLKMMKTCETRRLIDGALEYIHNYNLHVIDALTLSLAVAEGADLVSEDSHLLKASLLPHSKERGIRVLRLGELKS